jgi:glucose-6-phosphate 1-dehydrogenase
MGNKNKTIADKIIICPEPNLDNCSLVIFGASGNLTHEKLIIALFNKYKRNLLPDKFFIVGVARTNMDDQSFRDKVKESIKKKTVNEPSELIDMFINKCFYLKGQYDDSKTYDQLSIKLCKLEQDFLTGQNHIFYLAVPPNLYLTITQHIADAGLNRETESGFPFSRVIIEKPYGENIESAKILDKSLLNDFKESQIYRIDHFLEKETVQNILMFRFGNVFFEPIWNRHYIDNIQITVAENMGIGKRAGYFEKAGQLRDVFQNHMMQILSVVTMEPPVSLEAEYLRDEKVKVMNSIRPFPANELDKYIVRGQYGPGEVNNIKIKGYREEPGVKQDSTVETFIAAIMYIDNWRWQDVPIYLRTGKNLTKNISAVVVTFRKVPNSMFTHISPDGIPTDILVFNLQHDEGIALTIQVKSPGDKNCVAPITMELNYFDVFGINAQDTYERLLLDCMRGDQSFFIRSDEMKASLRLCAPILGSWENVSEPDDSLFIYPSGNWGPKAADELLQYNGHKWWTFAD